MEIELLSLIVGILVVLNIIVSIFIARRDDLNSFQKKSQIIITWLIPFIAAITFWFINKGHDRENKKNKDFGGGSNHQVDNIGESGCD